MYYDGIVQANYIVCQFFDRWRHAPFSGKVFDGRVHGWGVADDLAGCAAGLAAMADIASSEVCVGDLVFASTPSKNHARGVSALFHSGHRTDAALYLHPAESGIGMQEIKAVTAGQMEFEVSIKGRPPDTTEPSHTAFSHLGQNPVDKAFLIYRALKALNEARASRVSYPAIEALVGRATNLHVSSIAVTGTTELSRIPESCVVGGATSFPPGERLADVQHEIEHALKQANDADEWLSENPAKIKWISGVTGSEVPEDHPLFIAASQAIERVTGVSPRVNPMHSASDIRNPMIQAGIPCIGLGCLGGNLSQNGATDEWVDEEDFKRMASVVALVIRNWAVA